MNKKIIFLILFLFAQASIRAKEIKEHEVPANVKATLKTRYPNVYVYEWEWKKKEGVYKAEFMKEGKEYNAYFNSEGKWLRTKKDMKRNELSPAVYKAMDNAGYSAWKIDDVDELETPQHPSLFIIELEKGKQEIILHILPDGKILETITKK